MEKVVFEITSKHEVEIEGKVTVYVNGKKIIEQKIEKVEQSEPDIRH